jgi:peptidoglycan hydrolase-like protein with peptidoglycan-binding domain
MKHRFAGVLAAAVLFMPVLALAHDEALTEDPGFLASMIQSLRLEILELQDMAAAVIGIGRKDNGCINLTYIMGLGRRDSGTNGQVSILQKFLRNQGFIMREPNGKFDAETEAAVQAFQTAHGIVSGGTASTTGFGAVGKSTREKIRDLTCETDADPTSTGTPTSTPVASSTQPLKITVVHPNGGESLVQGKPAVITWTVKTDGGVDTMAPVDIYLVPDRFLKIAQFNPYVPFTVAKNVKPQTADRQSFDWTIGKLTPRRALPDGAYFVQVCVSGSKKKAACDLSDASMTVKTENPPILSAIKFVPSAVQSGGSVSLRVTSKYVPEYSLKFSCPPGVSVIGSASKELCNTTVKVSPAAASYAVRAMNTTGRPQRVSVIVEAAGISDRVLSRKTDVTVAPAAAGNQDVLDQGPSAGNGTTTGGSGGDNTDTGAIWDKHKAI